MITVTEEAKVLLQNVKRPKGIPEETVLRLDPVVTHQANGSDAEAQLDLSFGEARDDDQVVEYEERDLLRIACSVSEALDGSTLHLVQTPEGRGLGIEPPTSERPVSGDSS
jgi:iron-sulfur cluster assembly protein